MRTMSELTQMEAIKMLEGAFAAATVDAPIVSQKYAECFAPTLVTSGAARKSSSANADCSVSP